MSVFARADLSQQLSDIPDKRTLDDVLLPGFKVIEVFQMKESSLKPYGGAKSQQTCRCVLRTWTGLGLSRGQDSSRVI